MYGPHFPLASPRYRLLLFVIKLALYGIFMSIFLRGLRRWSRPCRRTSLNNGRDGRCDRHRTVPAAAGNRLAPVSELRAIWSDQAAEEDKEMVPAAQTALPPSPADDATRLEGIVIELAEVEAALRRLDDGSYGICEGCGTRLSPETLAADPLTTRCPQHAG